MSLPLLNKPVQEKKWYYSDIVKDHFYHPRNLQKRSDPTMKFDGVGLVGNPACGDYMKMWIKVENNRIVECKWQTFGCASAIASTSMLSVMVTEKGGMLIKDALNIKPQDIISRLGGLPVRKVHCSVLGDKALFSAINDYFRRSGQENCIIKQPAKIIDRATGVTDKDIENAVIEGAVTMEQLQEKTKVGIGNPAILQEVEQLLEFYKEKYFG